MPDKITAAVDRLNRILPLRQNQEKLDASLKQLHLDILRSYVETGRSLNRQEIAQRVDDLDAAIDMLRKNDLVVFDANGEPVGAYPFTMEARVHKIRLNGHLVHSMCALDSLAVSPMYNTELQIDSSCHLSAQPIHIRQSGYDIINPSEVQDVYFGINWSAASSGGCCADSLCTEMVFLSGRQLAHDWLAGDATNRQLFTLTEAIEFAAGFFMPLLE